MYFYQEGQPDEGGTRKQSAILTGAFGKVNFTIKEMCPLFERLSSIFAFRYTKPKAPKPVLPDDSEDDDDELDRQFQEAKHKKGMAKLNKGSWLYTTLEAFAAWMPERGRNELDWVDNTLATKVTVKPENKLKRQGDLTSADCNIQLTRVLKKSKGYDGRATQRLTSNVMN